MPLARSALVAAALAALALPAAAAAKHHDRGGKAERHGHAVTYVLKGTWSGGALQVAHANAHGRHAGLVGQSVALDLTGARIRVDDVDGDGTRDAADVRDGDSVLVQLRLPRRAPGDGPFAVRKLVDRTHAPSADDDDGAAEPDEG
jgi:hypothetical protein